MKFLGITEEVTSCDCCGKSDLLCTVAMETDDGDVVHYGRTCASRHSGRKVSVMVSEKLAADRLIRASIKRLIELTPEHLALRAKFALREKANILPGLAAKQFLEPESSVFDAVEKAIWANAPVARYEGASK